MAIERAQPGDRLRIRASDWNQIARIVDQAVRNTGDVSQAFGRQTTVLVQNNSGSAVVQGGILGIDTPVIDEATGSDEFKNNLALDCSTPAAATHTGQFVVTTAPIANGEFGLAVVSGTAVCQVQFDNADHTWADVDDGEVGNLLSGLSGSAKILWSSATTGTVWAVVRIGNPQPGTNLFAVKVWANGGVLGDAETQCTTVYKVRTIEATDEDTGGVSFGTDLEPEKRRPAAGKLDVAASSGSGTYGLGFYDENGDFLLYDANETLAISPCVGVGDPVILDRGVIT